MASLVGATHSCNANGNKANLICSEEKLNNGQFNISTGCLTWIQKCPYTSNDILPHKSMFSESKIPSFGQYVITENSFC